MINTDDLKYFIPYLFRENIFPHQIFQEKSTIAYMHYSLPQIRDYTDPDISAFIKRTPENDREEIFKWLDFLASNPFGVAVRDYILSKWHQISKELKHFASFNVHIEGNMPCHNIYKSKLFAHYHPARLGTGKSMTYTFVTPLCLNTEVAETIRYADYTDIGFKSKSQQEVFAGCKTRYDHAVAMYDAYMNSEAPGLSWKLLPFPTTGTLNLKFDGARYPHSVENEGDNVFIVLVFNDVEFVDSTDCQKHDDFFYQYQND